MTTTTDLATRADMAALALAATLPAATVREVLNGTERGVARKISGSTEETTARADALARGLRAVAAGVPTGQAIGAAVRDAVRDAVERAACEDLWSLDMTTADGTTTLADLLDSDTGHTTARLSAYDDAAGIYRGVARVPHPEDITRPLEMPAPTLMADMARQRITTDAARVLDVTVAVNVAAENARLQYAADCQRDAAQADADSRGARARAIRAALKSHRNETRGAQNPWRPRTQETDHALNGRSTGRTRAALAILQADAYAAYWTHRDAIASAALAAWTERIDAMADSQRASIGATRARIGTRTRWERVTTYAAIAMARTARRDAALAEWDAAHPHHATTLAGQRVDAAEGVTMADPRDAEHGTRPRRSLAEWDGWRALPGSTRRPSARMASASDPGTDPRTTRTAADAERAHRGASTDGRTVVPFGRVPGSAAPVPAAPVAAYVVTDADRAAWRHAWRVADAVTLLTRGTRGAFYGPRVPAALAPVAIARALGVPA